MVPDPAPAVAARDYVLATHDGTISGVLAAAESVADDWPTLADGRRVAADRDEVVGPLRAELDRREILELLPAVLSGAIEAAGYRLSAPPVAAPPYVAVTSTGPVLRGTVADGRLVVAVDCFSVLRGAEMAGHADRTPRRVVYALGGTDANAALSVRFHPDSS